MTLVRGNDAEVSVLVPAKDEAENLPEFLKQCEAVLRDVPYACEVVVVDDGSSDETPAVLEALKSEHHFLRVVTHRSRRGIAKALNARGIKTLRKGTGTWSHVAVSRVLASTGHPSISCTPK